MTTVWVGLIVLGLSLHIFLQDGDMELSLGLQTSSKYFLLFSAQWQLVEQADPVPKAT